MIGHGGGAMTRSGSATRAMILGCVVLGGCATSVDTESSPSGDTGKKSDGTSDGVLEDASIDDSRPGDTSVSDTSTADDTTIGEDTTPPDDTAPPLPDVISIDVGSGTPCGASTCGPSESCCPFTLTCYASACLSCCSPKLDAGGFDTPIADTGDKCALVKCASGLVCCPSTGLCYSKLCLACCPSTI